MRKKIDKLTAEYKKFDEIAMDKLMFVKEKLFGKDRILPKIVEAKSEPASQDEDWGIVKLAKSQARNRNYEGKYGTEY